MSPAKLISIGARLFLIGCLVWLAAMPAMTQAQVIQTDPPPTQEELGEEWFLQRINSNDDQDAEKAADEMRGFRDPRWDDPEVESLPVVSDTPVQPMADRTVGSGCAYATIANAMAAANPGDRLLLEGGVTFYENLSVQKSLTIQGGYAGCASGSTARTTINGGGVGRVMYIHENLTITLANLNLTNGNSGGNGAGVFVRWGTTVQGNNLRIYNNVSAALGGGVRLWGGSATFTNTAIYNNTATAGAGVYGELYNLVAPTLNLSNAADVYDNQALSGDGFGGGVYMSEGTVLIGENSDVYSNDAIRGGGLYLTTSSTLTAVGARIGLATASGGNTATLGAGIYAENSTLNFEGQIINNRASTSGGGLYAMASTVNLTNSVVGGTAANTPNQIGASGLNGGGMYLIQNTQATLQNTIVSGNVLTNTSTGYGGGIYVRDSVVTINDSRIEGHFLPSAFDGRGAGMYVYTGTVTLDNSDVVDNTASGFGGGMRVFTGGTINVQNGSEVSDNHALSGNGGGIAAGSGAPVINLSDSVMMGNSASGDGGAIHISEGTLNFSGGWTLHSNEAGGNGGAVAVTGTADPGFTAGSYSLVYNNKALGGNGGGVYLGSNSTTQMYATSIAAELSIYANTAQVSGGGLFANAGGLFDIYGQVNFERNWALTGHGGGIYLSNGSRVWLDDYFTTRPAMWDNRAAAGNGGAIYAENSPQVEMDGAIIGVAGAGNLAMAGSGGAVYLNNSTFNAENCTFQDNQATLNGGAIAAIGASVVTIDANLIAPLGIEGAEEARVTAATQATGCDPRLRECSAMIGNQADSDLNSSGDGGAVFINDSSLLMERTILGHNGANRGGALFQTGAAAVSDVSNSLIHHNSSVLAFGAGIRSAGGTFTLYHVTLANNMGGAAYSQSGTSTTVHNSIAWGNSTGMLGTFAAATCNIDQDGNAGPSQDPRFVNPGTGEDYHLLDTSPAIDACPSGLTPDLENVPRPYGDSFDMGAYEYVPPPPTFLPIVVR